MAAALGVSLSVVLALILTLLISLLLPAALFLLIRKKTGVSAAPLLAGIIAYYISVPVLEGLAYRLLQGSDAFRVLFGRSAAFYAVISGLLAGLFEESGRFVAFRFFLKGHRGVPCPVAYGIGHWGLESLLLTGLPAASALLYALMLNTGGMGPALAVGTAGAYLAGGISRIAALIFQVAASVLVWLAATRQGPIFLYPLAVLLHLLVFFPAAFYRFGAVQSIWLAEPVTLILSAAVGFVAYRIWIACRGMSSEPPPAPNRREESIPDASPEEQ